MNYRMFIVLSFLALSLSVAAKGAYAAEGDVKPGWGYGDTGSVHVGPPGLSNRPQSENQASKWFSNVFKAVYSYSFGKIFSR